MTPIVEASGLRKSYGEFDAVRGIDLTLTQGEYLGILGPNGAGKSTTMGLLSSVLGRTAGQLSIMGLDPAKHGAQIRRRLGVCPQDDLLDTELSVRQNLVTFGRYFGLSRRTLADRADLLLTWMDLTDKANGRVADLSGGLRRRLSIARSLINEPELLLLDEPTTGLDPVARRLVWERVRSLRAGGLSLILTTHFMDEAEQLCDRILMMRSGLVLAEGTPAELIQHHVGYEVLELPSSRIAPETANRLSEQGIRVDVTGDRHLIYAASRSGSETLVRQLSPAEQAVLYVRRASLEDVYITLTGEQHDPTESAPAELRA